MNEVAVITAFILTVIFTVFVLRNISNIFSADRIVRNGLHTTGTLIRFERFRDHIWPVVSYQINNQSYTSTSRFTVGCLDFKEGDTVDIYCSANDPEDVFCGSFIKYRTRMIIYSCLIVIGIFLMDTGSLMV